MEVFARPHVSGQLETTTAFTMDADMDIDMDIDLGPIGADEPEQNVGLSCLCSFPITLY